MQGARSAQGTIRPCESLIISLKYCNKMMSSHNALQHLVHRSKSESAGEEKWRLNTCAFETSTIMINEGSCPKYYFQMMNNSSIWRIEWLLIMFSLEKPAQILEIVWNLQPAQLKVAEFRDANVGIRTGPPAVFQVLKWNGPRCSNPDLPAPGRETGV